MNRCTAMAERLVRSAAVVLALACFGTAATAAELKVLCANAMESAVTQLAPAFERETGHTLALTFGTLGRHVKRLQAGEAADVIIIPKQGIDTLIAAGKITADGVVVIGATRMGVAVRKGAPKPDVSSPEALKRALLAAKAITYSEPSRGGTSGPHTQRVLERLGIAEEMKTKTVFLPSGGLIGVLVENGQADIAIHEFQQLLQVPGIEIVGPLPSELQNTVTFAAAVTSGSTQREASKRLLNFLRSANATAVFKARGVDVVTN